MLDGTSLVVKVKLCKPDSLVFRHKLERPRYIPHHPFLHHISSNYQSPSSLFRPCIMCAVETTKRPNRKHTFYMPPLNLSHFLGKHLLFYFLGSRTPELKLMNGWNMIQELTVWIISENSRLNLLKQLGRTDRRTHLDAEIWFCSTLNVVWTLEPVLATIPGQAEVRILIRSIFAGLDSVTHGAGR